MEKLTNNEMMNISGGAIENCDDWVRVIKWLNDHKHYDQAQSVIDNNFYGCIG